MYTVNLESCPQTFLPRYKVNESQLLHKIDDYITVFISLGGAGFRALYVYHLLQYWFCWVCAEKNHTLQCLQHAYHLTLENNSAVKWNIGWWIRVQSKLLVTFVSALFCWCCMATCLDSTLWRGIWTGVSSSLNTRRSRQQSPLQVTIWIR